MRHDATCLWLGKKRSESATVGDGLVLCRARRSVAASQRLSVAGEPIPHSHLFRALEFLPCCKIHAVVLGEKNRTSSVSYCCPTYSSFLTLSVLSLPPAHTL